MTETGQDIPTPTSDCETEVFWQAASEGRLLLRRCQDCCRFHWYPRSTCPFCFAGNTEWMESDGLGWIYSFTIFRRSAKPYAVAYVELEEGPRILTRIQTENLDSIRIGQRVEVAFVRSSTPPVQYVPIFRPAPFV